MDIETELLDTIRALPPERQTEIVDFVEFIKQRSGQKLQERPVGLCEGEFIVPEDFDTPLPGSILCDFES